MFKIIDNFLDEDKINQINYLIKSSDFHWNLTSSLNGNSNDGDWQGYHLIVEKGIIISPNSMFNLSSNEDLKFWKFLRQQ